jgi:TPR repeat protein
MPPGRRQLARRQQLTTAGRALLRWATGAILALALAACAWTNPKQVQAAFDEGVRAYDAGDFTAAYNAWLPLARSGDLAAQRNIGHLYETGRGVPADPKEAAVWYRKAAEDGFSRAQANLANLYLKGEGVPQDDREAALWFHKAALQGHAVAQYNLGAMYEQGRGVERDPARALGWLMLAAKAGHPQAQEAVAKVMANPAPEGIPDSLKAEPRPAKSPPSKPAPEPPPPKAVEPASDPVTGFFRNLFGLEPAKPAPDKRSEAPPAPPQPDPVPVAQVAAAPPPKLPQAMLVRASSGDPVAAGLAAYHGGQFHQAREVVPGRRGGSVRPGKCLSMVEPSRPQRAPGGQGATARSDRRDVVERAGRGGTAAAGMAAGTLTDRD